MSAILIAFLVAFLIPLLIGSWRLGFLGLAFQTLALAVMNLNLSEDYGLFTALQILDLAVIRGIIVPVILISTIKKINIPADFDFIPPNFLYWLALFLVIGSGLGFGHLIYPEDFQKSLHCGAAAAGVVGSFFILSLQTAVIGQLFAILLLENSILLFEFLSPHHQQNYAIQGGVSILFLLLILVVRIFLKKLPVMTAADSASEDKGRDLI